MLGTLPRTVEPALIALGAPCDLSDCPFCPQQLNASLSPFDRVLAIGDEAKLLPALGMLVPGYLLVTSNDHRLSMADLGSDALPRLAEWITGLTQVLAPAFGDYLVFEHGSCAADSGGSCIDHAHLHLVPLARELGPLLQARLPWQELGCYEELSAFAGMSYFYLGLSRRHLVIREPRLGSQWIRREIGRLVGTDAWDWAVDSGKGNLERTLLHLPRLAT